MNKRHFSNIMAIKLLILLNWKFYLNFHINQMCLCFWHLAKLQKQMNVCSCHVTYAFQSESTIYSCLNVKEFLTWSRREIWRLSDCNWTQTKNHLVHKRTLNHLAEVFIYELRRSGFKPSCSYKNKALKKYCTKK